MAIKLYALTDSVKLNLNRALVKKAMDSGVFKNAASASLSDGEIVTAWKYAQEKTAYLMSLPGNKDYRTTVDRIFCHILAAMACVKRGIIREIPNLDNPQKDFRNGVAVVENRVRYLIVGSKRGCFPVVRRNERREVVFCTISSTNVVLNDDGMCRISIAPDGQNHITVTVLGKASSDAVCQYQDPEYNNEFDMSCAGFYGYSSIEPISVIYSPDEASCPVTEYTPTDLRNLLLVLSSSAN